jgi:hypothetical protein
MTARRLMICAALSLSMFALPALAGKCPKCADLMYTMDVGQCVECQGATASGAFKLCGKCSDKLGQCENCRTPMTKPAAKEPVAKGPTVKIIEAKCKIVELKSEECKACQESRAKTGKPVTHIRACAETWIKVDILEATQGTLDVKQLWIRPATGVLLEAKPGVEGLATLEPYTQKTPANDRFICTKFAVITR